MKVINWQKNSKQNNSYSKLEVPSRQLRLYLSCMIADSGRGVSRPNSQIDVVDLRVSRTDSVGKKSVQSVVAEQGAKSDIGKKPTSKQAIVEGECLVPWMAE